MVDAGHSLTRLFPNSITHNSHAARLNHLDRHRTTRGPVGKTQQAIPVVFNEVLRAGERRWRYTRCFKNTYRRATLARATTGRTAAADMVMADILVGLCVQRWGQVGADRDPLHQGQSERNGLKCVPARQIVLISDSPAWLNVWRWVSILCIIEADTRNEKEVSSSDGSKSSRYSCIDVH